MDEISEKAIEIKKHKAVTKIVKQAIKSEQDSKLRLVTQLNTLQKRKNEIIIVENRNANAIEKL